MARKPFYPDGQALFETGRNFEQCDPLDNMTTFLGKYVCGTCYHDLARFSLADGSEAIMCSDPDCSAQGFVTRNWAEQSKAQSHYDLLNAQYDTRDTPFGKMVKKALGEIKSNPKEDSILKSLGF